MARNCAATLRAVSSAWLVALSATIRGTTSQTKIIAAITMIGIGPIICHARLWRRCRFIVASLEVASPRKAVVATDMSLCSASPGRIAALALLLHAKDRESALERGTATGLA